MVSTIATEETTLPSQLLTLTIRKTAIAKARSTPIILVDVICYCYQPTWKTIRSPPDSNPDIHVVDPSYSQHMTISKPRCVPHLPLASHPHQYSMWVSCPHIGGLILSQSNCWSITAEEDDSIWSLHQHRSDPSADLSANQVVHNSLKQGLTTWAWHSPVSLNCPEVWQLWATIVLTVLPFYL